MKKAEFEARRGGKRELVRVGNVLKGESERPGGFRKKPYEPSRLSGMKKDPNASG